MGKPFRTKVHEHVRRPASLSGTYLSSDDISELLRTPIGDLNFGDFRALICTSIEGGLYYLPYAFDFMQSDCDDRGEISFQVVNFVRSYTTEFRQMRLLDDALGELRHIFFVWIDAFSGQTIYNARDDLIITASVVGHEDRNELLDCLHGDEDIVTVGDTDVLRRMCHEILREWSTKPSSAARSAHLLDFLLIQVREKFFPLQIYDDAFVCELASDLDMCRRHWKVAADTITSQCPKEYKDVIIEQLF